MTNDKIKELHKKYIGKVGLMSFDGLQIQVKVVDVKQLAGRDHVLVTPVGKSNGGQVWKYAGNVRFK